MLKFIVGDFTDQNKQAVYNSLNNLVWINPTKDMSLFEVNAFKNNLFDLMCNLEDDTEFYIWTNQPDLIDSVNVPFIEVENGQCHDIEFAVAMTRSECLYRNWQKITKTYTIA